MKKNKNIQIQEAKREEFEAARLTEVARRAHDALTDTEAHDSNRDAEEVGTVIGRLAERLDQFFAQAAFQFSYNLRWSSGKWTDGPWLRDFIVALNPRARKIEDRICAVLDEETDNTRPERYDLSADFTFMVGLHQEAAYTVGVLVGARMAGMSSEKVKDLATFLQTGWF